VCHFLPGGARDDEVDDVVRGAEIERHGGKLGCGAALEEEDRILRRDLEEGANTPLMSDPPQL